MRRYQQGMTLAELMATTAILAILAGLAAPSFEAIIAHHRLESTTNTLLGSLQVARLNAVTRGTYVGVFARENDWNKGWVVAEDSNCSDRLDEGDVVLQEIEAPPPQVSIRGNKGASGWINFDPAGVSDRCHGGFISTTLTLGSARQDDFYAVVLNAVGRARMCKADQTGACLGEKRS